jgi:hypothetical protein
LLHLIVGKEGEPVTPDVGWATFRLVAREAVQDAQDGGIEIASGQALEDFLDIVADHLSSAFELKDRTAIPRFFFDRRLRRGSN